LKLYHKTVTTNTAWYWHKNRHEEKWNRINNPEIKPHDFSHLIFNKGAKNIHLRNDNFFNKWCWEKLRSTCRRLKLDPDLSSCVKIISK
jgi:hypothetical protein